MATNFANGMGKSVMMSSSPKKAANIGKYIEKFSHFLATHFYLD
jgi:hypothetical protein